MSGQTAAEMMVRLRRVAATSGPALMVAVPLVVAVALVFRGLDLGGASRPKDVTLAASSQQSLLLSAVGGSAQGRTGANTTAAKTASGRTEALAHRGVRSGSIRAVSLSRGPRLATLGSRAGTGSGWSGPGGPGGNASALRPSIQAGLVYERVTTACPSLTAVIHRGGLEGSLATAISGTEAAARRRGASEAETQSMIQRAIQSALIASGAAPRDVLVAVQDLSREYAVCGADPATLAALGGLGGVIRAQLNYSEPAATGGPGPAPIGNPVVPLPGGLGTATYLQQGR